MQKRKNWTRTSTLSIEQRFSLKIRAEFRDFSTVRSGYQSSILIVNICNVERCSTSRITLKVRRKCVAFGSYAESNLLLWHTANLEKARSACDYVFATNAAIFIYVPRADPYILLHADRDYSKMMRNHVYLTMQFCTERLGTCLSHCTRYCC